MKLRINGVRGSRPTHKKNLLGYGGNSTSFEIVTDESDGYYIFIDGGSGLAKRGREIRKKPMHHEYHMLVTHTHMDHILGYPLFEPMFDEKNTLHFYSSSTSKADFNNLFFGLQKQTHLPIPTNKIKAQTNFLQIFPQVGFSIGDKYHVTTFQLNHQGITLGYRIESEGASVAIVTDCAPSEDGNILGEKLRRDGESDQEFTKRFESGLITWLKGCHTVVFDTHFTEENLKPDWGHSTPDRALEFCIKAGVKRLVLFHHAPEDSDMDVDQKVKSVIKRASDHNIEVVAAKEGDEWELS